MKSFYLFFLLFFILFATFQSFAQEKEDFYRYGIQFEVSDNFTLSNFEGSSFSGKYFFNKDNGIRLNFTLFGSTLGKDVFEADTLATNQDDNSLQLQVALHYLLNLLNTEETNLYVLGGPLMSFNYTESSINPKSPFTSRSSVKYQSFNIGAVFGIGAEYFFRGNMSLNAEYNINLIYSYKRTEGYSASKRVSEITNFTIKPISVVFGLSVYF